jgi:hypothetical protein
MIPFLTFKFLFLTLSRMMPKKFYRQGMKSKVSNSNYFLIEAKSRSEDRNGIREENKSNNFVGKKKETHNFVGLVTIRFRINLKLFYAVGDNSLCGIKKPGRSGHIASRVFKGVDEQFSFEVSHGTFEGERRDRI